ncbi:MAG: ATP synthase F0 subunit B [Desulfobacteraceae bacterium]|nr:ATP synthase F0 subunit B [Desulfobacteraceae bacterium]
MKEKRTTQKCLKFIGYTAALVFSFGGIALASSGGGGVHNAWLGIDTAKVINFGVLIIALFFVAKKPVAEFFSSRAKGIEDEIKALEQKKAEAEKKLAEYQARFKSLDQESKKILEEYMKQGQEAKIRILAEAEAQAAKLEAMAKRNIEQEFKSAKTKLQQEIAEKAMIKAEELIKASISSDDQDKLVDEYLKKVVA